MIVQYNICLHSKKIKSKNKFLGEPAPLDPSQALPLHDGAEGTTVSTE